MRGSGGIFVIIGIMILAFLGFAYYLGFFRIDKNVSSPNPQPAYKSLSEDPQYQEVKDKYHLNEEQLQILSTVDPEDNE